MKVRSQTLTLSPLVEAWQDIDCFEHILVLSGSQTDHNGEHQTGTLVINPPGTNHSVISEAGCIVLAIWEKPVALVEC
jgi:anti-sigma factor ChrR (cupin superfamily)